MAANSQERETEAGVGNIERKRRNRMEHQKYVLVSLDFLFKILLVK